MVQVFRVVGLGLLVLAITLHLVGFVTHNWVSANLDMRGIQNIMNANGLGSHNPEMNQVGMSINMGLWKYCMHIDMGKMLKSMPGMEGVDGLNHDTCVSISSQVPDWMKAVRGLGIVALIIAVVGLALTIYSFVGDSKGDRARLLPYIIGSVCLASGMLFLIAATVYGTEFDKMMENQMSMMGTEDPSLKGLAENVKKHTNLGYSFILECITGVLMVLISLLVVIPEVRGWDTSISFGGPRNMAV